MLYIQASIILFNNLSAILTSEHRVTMDAVVIHVMLEQNSSLRTLQCCSRPQYSNIYQLGGHFSRWRQLLAGSLCPFYCANGNID